MFIHVTAADNKGSSLKAIIDSLKNKSSKAAVKEEKVPAVEMILRTIHVDNTLDSQIDPFPADEILRRARSKVSSAY